MKFSEHFAHVVTYQCYVRKVRHVVLIRRIIAFTRQNKTISAEFFRRVRRRRTSQVALRPNQRWLVPLENSALNCITGIQTDSQKSPATNRDSAFMQKAVTTKVCMESVANNYSASHLSCRLFRVFDQIRRGEALQIQLSKSCTYHFFHISFNLVQKWLEITTSSGGSLITQVPSKIFLQIFGGDSINRKRTY